MTPRPSTRTKIVAASASAAAIAALVTPVAATASGGSSAATAVPANRPSSALHRASEGPAALRGASQLLRQKGPLSVILELSAQPGTRAFAAARSRGAEAARTAEASAAAKVDAAERALLPRISGQHATVIYRTTQVLSGIAVRTDAAHLRALASLPGVVAVRPLTPKKLSNSHAVTVSKAPAAWAAGNTGAGAKIAIIDSGIDYTHKDFGGSGLIADYTTASGAAKNTAIVASPLTPANCSLTSVTGVSRDTAKVVDGCDLVGDAYDASGSGAALVPHPDANPLDCPGDTSGNEGHGSHVAGSAAGFGVLNAGNANPAGYTTYNAADFKIGPGTAPNASLVGLRVFGCAGSTLVVSEALDWVAAYNLANPGSPIKVLNLSLGSDFNRGDDPDAVALDNLTTTGVLPVVAAGNAGDLYAVAGSPGAAPDVLTVAASDDGADVVDSVGVTGVTGLTDAHAEYSIKFSYPASDVPATVGARTVAQPLSPANADGCDALSGPDAALVNGKIALLSWDDNSLTRRCGSATRSGNVVAAGATGAIFVNNADTFQAGINGSPTVPVALLTNTDGTAIQNAVVASPGTVSVVFNANRKNTLSLTHPATTDTPAGFTSRGGTTGDGVLKPDVSAPGVTIFSDDSGTGTGGHVLSGTSMATPHTAGIVADVAAAHPTYSAGQLKAAVMDTATDDITTGPNDPTTSGQVFSPTRVGSGRVRADLATSNDVLAFAGTDPSHGPVGVGLGPVAVTAPETLTRTITVQNTNPTTARTYTASFNTVDPVTGVTFSVTPTAVIVPAASSTTVTLHVALDPTVMRKDTDPTRDTLGGAVTTLAEATGRVILAPGGSYPGLRVPVAIAPRPASAMHASASSLTLPAPASGHVSTGSLALAGAGVADGIPSAPTSVNSLVSGFQLGASSGQLPSCSTPGATDSCILFPSERAGDIHYTGAAAHDGLLDIAINTYAPWLSPSYNADSNGFSGDVVFEAFVNSPADPVTGAHTTGFEIDAFRVPDTDFLLAETYDIANSFNVVDDEFINTVQPTTDTDLLNSDSMVLPVDLSLIGSPATVSYSVETFSADDQGGPLDVAPTATFDVAHPGISVGTTALSADQPGNSVGVTRDSTDTTQSHPNDILLIHHHNGDGSRAEVVHVNTAQTITLPSVPTHKVGDAAFAVAATASSGLPVTLTGAPSAVCATSGLDVTVLSAGTCTLTATQAGNDAFAAAPTVTTSFTVTGVPGVTLTPYPGPFVSGQPIPVVVSIGAGGATGTVTIKSGPKVLGTGTVSGSVAAVKLPGQHVGSYALTALYSGDASNPGATSPAVTVTVGKGKTTTVATAPATQAGHSVKVSVQVTPVSPAVGPVTGKVTVSSGGKKLATLTLKKGKASGKIKLGKGQHVVTFAYKGSADFGASSVKKTVTITG